MLDMKVIIQIPAYNEEETLSIAINALPKTLAGVDVVEYLIINDGSADKTVDIAKQCGVHHVVSHSSNQGLAKAFMTGLAACLERGADIIVNTDADNQYEADDIIKLVTPIIEGQAEFVIGERPISQTQHFSIAKKFLQKLGSWVVRVLSGTNIKDAPSGFRAISREAALKFNVFTTYTYTLETIIQAGQLGIKTVSVPVRTNGDLRPSKLVKSIPQYVKQSILTMLRVVNTYKPLRTFINLTIIFLIPGVVLLARWVIFYSADTPATHIPSLIIAIGLVITALQFLIFGLIADLVAVNRLLLEDVQLRLRKERVAGLSDNK
jgi:glycosyltransferase involved in cell wall biosynthesis